MSKNILTVMFLGIPLIYGMPLDLKKEVEKARCVIMNLPPAPISEEQFLEAQAKLEVCIKDLMDYLKSESRDREVKNKMLRLKSDLRFLKGCHEILLGREGFDSPTAQQWRDCAYIFESYLNHFRGR